MTRSWIKENRSAPFKRHGFTLTELSIVVGIIGLVLGAIWVAAAQVSNHKKYTKAETEVLTILDEVRANFSAKGLSPGDNTGAMITAGIIPSDMINAASPTGAISPWGTPFSINTGVVPPDTFDPMKFWIDFAFKTNNLTPDVCVNLLSQIAQIPNIGLIRVFTGSTFILDPASVSRTALLAACAGDASFQFSIQ